MEDSEENIQVDNGTERVKVTFIIQSDAHTSGSTV